MYAPSLEEINLCQNLVKVTENNQLNLSKDDQNFMVNSFHEIQGNPYKNILFLLSYTRYSLEKYSVLIKENGKNVLFLPTLNSTHTLILDMNEFRQHIEREWLSFQCMLLTFFLVATFIGVSSFFF